MPRIIVDCPERWNYETEIPVFSWHINSFDHLDNVAFLALASEARTRYFTSLGIEPLKDPAIGFVVADVAMQYCSEARYGETLRFQLVARDFNKYGCDVLFRSVCTTDGREVSRGKIGMVCINMKSRRVALLPAEVRTALESSAPNTGP